MAKTYAQLLTKSKEALEAILDGAQEYTIGGRTWKRADLGQLQETIDWLERKVDAQSDSTNKTGLATFGDP